MFPLSDSNPRQSLPLINYLIILSNIVVFIYIFSSGDIEGLINKFAFVPARFNFFEVSSYSTIISSMWLHGGLLHLVSNMWFLHIFGDNVEDQMGHIWYLLFYLTCGVIAVFSQYLLSIGSFIPLIGASGAISGVTGAYFVFFKKSRIKAVIPTFFGLYDIVELPSWFFLGYWFILQIILGAGSLAPGSSDGGVAFFAHIGGFISGYIIANLLYNKSDDSL